MKTFITKPNYFTIVGLLEVGQQHMRATEELIKALREVTGEEDTFGHCADAIYSDYSPDELLEKLDLKVKK